MNRTDIPNQPPDPDPLVSIQICDPVETGCTSTLAYLQILGMVVAAVISYERYRSIGYAVLHGALAWIYIIYRVLTGG